MADLLQTTAASALNLSPNEVTDETAMGQCPAWDSLSHFNMILAVEQAFGVRFSSAVIPDLTSVGKLRKELQSLGARSA